MRCIGRYSIKYEHKFSVKSGGQSQWCMRLTQHFICNVGGGGGQVKLADDLSTVIDMAFRLSGEIINITLPQLIILCFSFFIW
jgi:hypothetical protein